MIEPRYQTLQQLFTDRVFRIPQYQRFYSWRKKQRDDLFNDLRHLQRGEDDDHHFMATIVCFRTQEKKMVGSDEYRLYDVVDGQQRLTTLIILLKCIHLQLLTNQSEEFEDEKKALSKLLVKTDENLILLQTNNANEFLFNAFLRKGTLPKLDSLDTDADRQILNAIRECQEFVKEWQEDTGDVFSLLRILKNRLGFVVYDTENAKLVYNLFEILNSRGLAVDWLDKCKSMLMGAAYENAASEEAALAATSNLQKIWASIYKKLAEVSVSGQEILRVTATLRHGPASGKPQQADDSIRLFREDCTNATMPEEISNYLLDVATKLVGLERNIVLGPVTRILHARILAVALLSTTVEPAPNSVS